MSKALYEFLEEYKDEIAPTSEDIRALIVKFFEEPIMKQDPYIYMSSSDAKAIDDYMNDPKVSYEEKKNLMALLSAIAMRNAGW